MATETWLLNNHFNFKNTQWIILSASFTSNGQSFSSIKYSYADFDCHYINYDNTSVYDDDGHIGWADEAYRTIVLDTPAAGDLLTWLQANAVKQVTPRVSVDLATAFPDKWAALTPGKHTLQIRAKNPGNYLDSDLSTAITFVKVVNWTINITATNCTADASNPTVVPSNTTAENPVILKFNKVTGYTLPASVVLDGIADDGYTWAVSSDGTVGTITIIAPTGNITGTITGVAETYNITVKGTNARQASGPSTIAYGGSATLTFAYDDGYFAPTDVTVVGADKTWTASTSTLNLTNCTGPVTVTVEGAVKTYTITPTLTNCTWDTENATTIASNQFTPIQLIINKNTGWTLPTEISVSGVDAEHWTWNQATGIVTISHPQGNVTITADAVREVYNITTNLTHAVAGSGNPTTVGYGLSATLTFTFPTGYEAPADVTVTGATKSWEAGTGTLTLTNATGPVTVTVVGVATTTTIDGGTYKWHDNAALTQWTQEINFTSNGASYSGMRYTGNGTAMTLQYMNADSEWQTVYNYDEDASTGSWVNTAWQIVDLGTSAQTVTAIFKADFVANTTKLTQLATPQNVTADGTNVSWDAVENATSYEVIEGGNNVLGTVTPSYKVTVTIDENSIYARQQFTVRDGGQNGNVLYTNTSSSGSIPSPQTFDITSGKITFYIAGMGGTTCSASDIVGLEYNQAESDEIPPITKVYNVTNNGSISLNINYDI